jgi:hypothetical protein
MGQRDINRLAVDVNTQMQNEASSTQHSDAVQYTSYRDQLVRSIGSRGTAPHAVTSACIVLNPAWIQHVEQIRFSNSPVSPDLFLLILVLSYSNETTAPHGSVLCRRMFGPWVWARVSRIEQQRGGRETVYLRY